MKKLLFSVAMFGILFAACNKDDDKETAKLPSKITFTDPDNPTRIITLSFEYDNQNRMIMEIWTGSDYRDTTWFLYESGNSPVKRRFSYVEDGGYTSQGEREIKHVNNLIIMNSDTLVLNTNGKLVEFIEGGYGSTFYHHNSNGNVNKITYSDQPDREDIISYSNTKTIARHINAPDWFMFWWYWIEYPTEGYMPSKIEGKWGSNAYTYTTEGGYVKTRTEVEVYNSNNSPAAKNLRENHTKSSIRKSSTWAQIATYEYVNAK